MLAFRPEADTQTAGGVNHRSHWQSHPKAGGRHKNAQQMCRTSGLAFGIATVYALGLIPTLLPNEYIGEKGARDQTQLSFLSTRTTYINSETVSEGSIEYEYEYRDA